MTRHDQFRRRMASGAKSARTGSRLRVCSTTRSRQRPLTKLPREVGGYRTVTESFWRRSRLPGTAKPIHLKSRSNSSTRRARRNQESFTPWRRESGFASRRRGVGCPCWTGSELDDLIAVSQAPDYQRSVPQVPGLASRFQCIDSMR